MLPKIEQFGEASQHLLDSRDLGICAATLDATGNDCDQFKTAAVEQLKLAATALGYELVQRITPAARDGGRMEMEADANG